MEIVRPDEDGDIDQGATRYILFGCVVHKKIPKTLKNGRVKYYGPYGYHVIKRPGSRDHQIWEYMGKFDSDDTTMR